jgi:hypothetical protein
MADRTGTRFQPSRPGFLRIAPIYICGCHRQVEPVWLSIEGEVAPPYATLNGLRAIGSDTRCRFVAYRHGIRSFGHTREVFAWGPYR